jgi:dihydropteroate synthase
VIEAVAQRFDIPVSIDTSKSTVAQAAIAAGAEIVNDISGLRFDERIAAVAAAHGTGLVLMHSRGDFETMHSQPPVEDVFQEVNDGLGDSIAKAESAGVDRGRIVLDIGIGFGKTLQQNLQLIARLDEIVRNFPDLPVLVGASRKSFLGKILGGAAENDRLSASVAAAAIGAWNGARIVRVHDVRATRDAIAVVHRLGLER